MKLYTLGTSHGGCEIGRSCSGNLLQCGDSFYLFDCGADIESKMKNMNLATGKIRAVFISHMHIDHIVNLPAIIKCFANGYNGMDTSLKIYLPDACDIDALKAWLSATSLNAESERLTYGVCSESEFYSDEFITVNVIKTEHMLSVKKPSFAFDIKASDGKRLLYTGDLSCDFHDYPGVALIENFDLILSELVHFSIEKNLDTIIKSKTKKMIFTHLAPRNIPVIEGAADKFPFAFEIASDGMCFEV